VTFVVYVGVIFFWWQLTSLVKLKRWEEGVRFCEKYYAPLRPESPLDESPSIRDSNPFAPAKVITRMGTLEQKGYIRCLRYTDREEDAVAALNGLLSRHPHLPWCSKELIRIRAIRKSKEAGDAAFRDREYDVSNDGDTLGGKTRTTTIAAPAVRVPWLALTLVSVFDRWHWHTMRKHSDWIQNGM